MRETQVCLVFILNVAHGTTHQRTPWQPISSVRSVLQRKLRRSVRHCFALLNYHTVHFSDWRTRYSKTLKRHKKEQCPVVQKPDLSAARQERELYLGWHWEGNVPVRDEDSQAQNPQSVETSPTQLPTQSIAAFTPISRRDHLVGSSSREDPMHVAPSQETVKRAASSRRGSTPSSRTLVLPESDRVHTRSPSPPERDHVMRILFPGYVPPSPSP